MGRRKIFMAVSSIIAVVYFLGFISLDYRSPRSLAMGGLSVSISDPQTAFFYNPAGLSGTKSLDLLYLDLRASYPLITDTKYFISDVLPNIGENPDKAFSTIKSSFGRNYSILAMTFPNFTATVNNVSFGVGILLGGGLGFQVSLPSNINMKNTFGFTQFEVVLGGSTSFMENTLKVGLSLSVFRISQLGEVEIRENEFGERITEIMPIFEKSVDEIIKDITSGRCVEPLICSFGFGGINIGAMWSPPVMKNITFGAGMRNILDPLGRTTGDIGVSYKDKLLFFSYIAGIEFNDIIFNEMEDKSVLKRLRFGTEFSTEIPFIKRFVSFMFGLGQTYSSFGLELNLKIISFTVGTYAEELGKEVGSNSLRYFFFKLSM